MLPVGVMRTGDHMTREKAIREIHIIGGGTVFHVRPHLAISAPAYGKTAKMLQALFLSKGVPGHLVKLHLTKMAGGETLETNADIANLVDTLINDAKPKIIVMNAALCDFDGYICKGYMAFNKAFVNDDNEVDDDITESGKDQPRLKTSDGNKLLRLVPADKIIGKIRKQRKDIFLVGFKTTAGATEEEQYEAGLTLLKKNSCNIVIANDVHTRMNKIITPEMASYANTTDRFEALIELVDIILARSTNEFSRTEVIDDVPVPFKLAPEPLRKVVEYCVEQGAYQPFNGVTVGHFGYLWDENTLVSSRRKQNYNTPFGLEMTRVFFREDGKVQAQGGKPSAGVRSQYELLKRFSQFDCVVHFHCPMKTSEMVPVRPQKYFECGSHQCGQNTAAGIKLFEQEGLGAVMLDKHGPNILFHSSVDPQNVIDFIEQHFDLSKRTK